VRYEEETARLLATVDGLTLHWVLDPAAMTPARAQRTLRRELATLLPGKCRQHRPAR
jgi:hypothetical protein